MTLNAPQNTADTEVVIVGTGAVLPEAMDVETFYDNVMAGRSAVVDLTQLADNSFRQFAAPVMAARGTYGMSYTNVGAPVDRSRIAKLGEALGLPLDKNLVSHIMTIEAVRQATASLPEDARAMTDCMLGYTSPASEGISIYFDNIEERFERFGGADLVPLLQAERDRYEFDRHKQLIICSVLTQKIRDFFNLGGACLLADAACASSFAAMLPAVLRLREGTSKYAIVGGTDDSLGSVNPLISFSHLGVLSEVPPVPFDKKSDGMVIGEGAVALLLTTKAEALRRGLTIQAVIKGIGGSSDGKSGGMTEPTVVGQMLSYERAYGNSQPAAMTYIEGHGTGTKVGDRVELESLSRYFANQSVPLGSAKYNVGHTMGCAGATGVLRALGVMQRRQVPPAPYFEAYPDDRKTSLTILKEPKKIPIKSTAKSELMNVGVSSFGFGGSNFHLWLQEHKESDAVSNITAMPTPALDVVLCAEAEADIKDVATLFRNTTYRLPPKAWPFIDKIQMLGVLITEKLFRDNSISPSQLDRMNVHVVTGSTQPLELQRETTERQLTTYMLGLLAQQRPDKKALIDKVASVAYDDMGEMNDTSILGGHCSLIAARVTKAFDFRGVNFNVDADYASGLMAIECARSILRAQGGAALVFDIIKEADKDECYLVGKAMRVSLLASADYARQYNLPVKAVVTPLEITRGRRAA